MKKNFSLILFICFLYLNNLTSASKINLKSTIKSKGFEDINEAVAEGASTSLAPNITNRGFKCVKLKVVEEPTKASRLFSLLEIKSINTNLNSNFKGTSTSKSSNKASISKKANLNSLKTTVTSKVLDKTPDKFFSIRLGQVIECVSKDQKACNIYDDIDTCKADFIKLSDPTNYMIVKELKHLKAIERFFFNRWICPSESGLRFTIRFEKSPRQKKYTVNCLGRSDDCYYDKNAITTCNRLNDCGKALVNFSKITCGTKEFSQRNFHNGFNTPLPTWCKKANAWLRFDAGIKITNDFKAVAMLDDGDNYCVPAPDNVTNCVKKSNVKELDTIISPFSKDISKFQTLIGCSSGKYFKEAVSRADHWCFDNTYSELSENGEIPIDLRTLTN